MLKKIVLVAAGVAALVVVVGLLLPRTAHVERSVVIDSPPATVFTLVNGFARFNEWSPWAELDTETVYRYEGPQAGVGARMTWQSDNPSVGAGSQEIVASEPYRLVRTLLDFGDQGTATAGFDLEPSDEGTRLTWFLDTDFGWNLFGRYLGVLMFDRLVGADYERGLQRLKRLAESLPKADWSNLAVDRVEVEGELLACAEGASATDHEAIGAALTEAFSAVASFLSRNRLEHAGPPRSVTTSWTDERWAFQACVPIGAAPRRPPAAGDPVQLVEGYSGPALRTTWTGPYVGITTTWQRLRAYAEAHGVPLGKHPYESYLNDPTVTPEDQLVTELTWPVAG